MVATIKLTCREYQVGTGHYPLALALDFCLKDAALEARIAAKVCRERNCS